MAKDRFHDAVRMALEKEGWTITADPYQMSVGDVDFEIDLAAQMLAAERAGEKIAVEIKSFIRKGFGQEAAVAEGNSGSCPSARDQREQGFKTPTEQEFSGSKSGGVRIPF